MEQSIQLKKEGTEEQININRENVVLGGGAVDSVNGQTGDVVLTTADLENTSDYQTGSEVEGAISQAISGIDVPGVVQSTGTSTTDVMSQNAVTEALANAGGGGAAKVLTSSDYNWPVSNPDGVALWLLDSGLYTVTDYSVKVYGLNNYSYSLSDYNNFLVVNGVNGLNKNLSYIYGFRHDFADINKNVITYSIIKRDDGSQYESGGQILTSRYTVDNLYSYNPIQPLSANQGRILNNNITAINTRLGGLTLVSISQADYDALTTKDANTLYVITEA